MPSVRDLKGKIVEADAAPVSRQVSSSGFRPAPTDVGPVVLPQAALDAKRRIEERKQGAGQQILEMPAESARQIRFPVPAESPASAPGVTNAEGSAQDALAALDVVEEHLAGLVDAIAFAREKMREAVTQEANMQSRLEKVDALLRTMRD